MGGPKWPCVNHVFDWCFCHFRFFGLEHHFGAICLMCTLLPMCVAMCMYVFGHVQVYRWSKRPMCSMCCMCTFLTFGSLLAGGHHLGPLVSCVHVVYMLGHVHARVWSCVCVQVAKTAHV